MISEQRDQLNDIVRTSPRLEGYLQAQVNQTYVGGRLLAAKETGIDFTLFPEACPFTVEQVLDEGFLPKEPDLLDQS